jgi:peptidylprolyl isomerase
MHEESSRIHDVFLSYSSKDKTWADAACAVLERHGVRCWIAPRDITPGEEWGAAIIRGINGSRIMVLIFSGHANDSGQVRREVERAISQGMTVLPVRIEDVRPEGAMEYALGNTHWLDAFTPPVERQFGLLARSVKTLLGHDVESATAPAAAKPAEVTGDEPARTKANPPVEPADATESRQPRASWPIAVAVSVIGLVALAVIMVTIQTRNGETRTTVSGDASTKAGRAESRPGPLDSPPGSERQNRVQTPSTPPTGIDAADAGQARQGSDKPMTRTRTGLQYRDLQEGTGERPHAGQTCVVHYTGWLWENNEKGKKFDSSRDRGRPLSFPVGEGRVIKGWDEGVATMKAGGKRELIIPSNLAYGAKGAGNAIPPHSTLFFEVELVEVR